MTKYIDRYYLNGEMYGIKFASGPQPFNKLIEDAVEDYHGTPAVQPNRAGVCVEGDYIYMGRYNQSINTMLKSSYTSSIYSTNNTKGRGICLDASKQYIYISDYETHKWYTGQLTTEGVVSGLTLSEYSSGTLYYRDMCCSPDGKEVYITSHYDGTIYQYSLPTAGSTAGVTVKSKKVGNNYTLSVCGWSPDGHYLFKDNSGATIGQYEASTPRDITSVDVDNPVSTFLLPSDAWGLDISRDGSGFYLQNPAGDLYHYTW